jgi:hypothetical protein
MIQWRKARNWPNPIALLVQVNPDRGVGAPELGEDKSFAIEQLPHGVMRVAGQQEETAYHQQLQGLFHAFADNPTHPPLLVIKMPSPVVYHC